LNGVPTPVVIMSATKGDGMETWYDWLANL
jgi:hypothetical protein